MKTVEKFKLLGLSVVIIGSLAACDKPGSAESAGKKIDESVENSARKMNETAERVGEKMENQSEKAGVAIDDAAITTKVKAAIFAEPNLKSLQISVDTVGGVVTLTGSVNSSADSDRAKAVAAAVEGVKNVDNHLAVK